MVEHFTQVSRAFTLGPIGVRLFFVLSGFLITRILLDHRRSAESVANAAAQFYWRRLLRLTPANYLGIGAALLLSLGNMAETWPTDMTYLTNLRVALQGKWDGSSHFWSLSVEEQFYLLWFVVVVVLPERWLAPMIWRMIYGAPIFRAVVLMCGGGEFWATLLLPDCMDALAAGALLAIFATTEWMRLLGSGWTLMLSLGLLAVTYVDNSLGVLCIVRPSIVDLVALSLIARCVYHTEAGGIDWLAWRPVVHIGRISYGLYVYHYVVLEAVDQYFPGAQSLGVGRFVLLATLSVAVAEVSWRAIEQPLLRMKERVPLLKRAMVG
jgi:peptidoglycan/LPS O-acetylase OafA/YrhL